jgi:peptidoglycan/LPS O-acetylase OafA/YrhL
MTDQDTSYRPDIDGLRAISILLVVTYHAHPWLVPSGFIGVDIFFVISGFLITQIILNDIRAKRFSVSRFYGRRIRRIFPALTIVLATTFAVGWFVLLPDRLQLLGKNVVAGVAFAANLFQITQAGYFSPSAVENPLLHLWSLGIEEQFYMFWPPILLLITGSAKRRLWFGLLAAGSFCAGLGVFFGYKDLSFYLPIARAWELLAGSVLVDLNLPKRRTILSENLLSTSGLIAILVSALVLNSDSRFPGILAILPVMGAVLILASPNSLLNRQILSSRIFVWIGLISYPLYLWHWPLLSYLVILRNGVPNFLEIWAALITAVILSAITYRFVEGPLRRRPAIVPTLSAGLAAVGAVGIAAIITNGFEFRFPPELQEIARLKTEDTPAFHDHCFLDAAGSAYDATCIEQGNKPLLFLWGDSTAAALYPGLKDAKDKMGSVRLARFNSPGCAPILESGANTRCDMDSQRAFEFILSARPEIVLLHFMWDQKIDLDKLRATIRQLQTSGVARIVLLGPVPVWKRTVPHALINAYRFSHVLPERIGTGVSGPEEDLRLESFSKMAGIEYISARKAFCDEQGCLTRAGPTAADVLMTDAVHLSDSGSKFLAAAIWNALFATP